MRFPRLASWLFTRLHTNVATARAPDFIVGADDPAGAYLRRWHLVPRNRLVNVYLHQFLRDDDDRALHDHPWAWLSLLLRGSYTEHTIAAGGIHLRAVRVTGSIKVSGPLRPHRIELWRDSRTGKPAPCWTLFITGPRVRRWGFHCPDAGWIDFERFTKPGATGETGAGCEG